MSYQSDTKLHIKRKARLIKGIMDNPNRFPFYEREDLQDLGILQLEIIYSNLPKNRSKTHV